MLRLGMSLQQTVELLGDPDTVTPRRASVPMFSFRRGKRIGVDHVYWLRKSVDADKRWLSLHFDTAGKLQCWRGNLGEGFFEQGQYPYGVEGR